MTQPSVALDVVTFGEAMLLLVAGQTGPLERVETFHKRIAGAETNVAIGLARLGVKVAWASRLGSDSMARYLLNTLIQEGVDCSHVICDATQRTGFMFKGRVDDGSDPLIEYHRSGSAASTMEPKDVDINWLVNARHLHATGVFAAVSPSTYALTLHCIRQMKAARRTVSFDPNLRPALWKSPEVMRSSINELAVLADWVLPGIDEGRILTGAATPEGIATYYRRLGVPLVVVKLGKDGAYFENEQAQGYVPGFFVENVVDTVGAGDGFAVGFISALLEGHSTQAAVRRGAWIGARAVQVMGDSEGLPKRLALDAAGM